MMKEKVIFQNNELLLESYNEKLKIDEKKPLPLKSFPRYYNSIVEFADDLTVEGFMHALRPFFKIIDTHFIGYTYGYKIQRFYNEMLRPAKKDTNDEISHVELYWSSEITDYNNLSSGKIESNFELYGDFHGVPKEKDSHYWGFSLSPLSNWKHYLFKLNKTIICTKFEEKEIVTIFKSEQEFTLHDIIRYFFYELTWHGYPSNVKKLSNNLNDISESIKNGTTETFPLNLTQMRIDLLDKELEKAKEEENFEGADRIFKEINKLKDKLKID